MASRALGDLGRLERGAREAGKRLATLSLDFEIRFASAQQRSAFADELSEAIAELVRRYHCEDAPKGRLFRFYLGGYPKPK